MREQKCGQSGPGHMTKMPIYCKNTLKSSKEPEGR